MHIGKLENEKLKELILDKFKRTRSEVLTDLETGVDCAALDFGGDIVVLSTDPITAAKSKLGFLTVNINCNDAAAYGAEPVALLVTVLAPRHVCEAELDALSTQIESAAQELNVNIIGGHTEITDAVSRTITSCVVIAKKSRGMEKRTVLPGDGIIMTKCAAIEGTALLALDHGEDLALSDDEMELAQSLIDRVSVVKEGLLAARLGAHAMHDVTEGGVLGAVHELVSPFGMGAIVDTDAIPILDITKHICHSLNIDPLRLISSGSMLIACEDCESMLRELREIGVKATLIARVTKESGVFTARGEVVDPPRRDEIYSRL